MSQMHAFADLGQAFPPVWALGWDHRADWALLLLQHSGRVLFLGGGRGLRKIGGRKTTFCQPKQVSSQVSFQR